jgi:hypothetical protein
MTENTKISESSFVVNKELLEIILNEDVDSFFLRSGSALGDNYMSVMHGAEVRVKGDDKPRHVLIKCYPTNAGRRDFLDQTDIFGTEFFFYTYLAPKFVEIIKRAGKDKEIHLGIPEFLCGNYTGSQLECK